MKKKKKKRLGKDINQLYEHSIYSNFEGLFLWAVEQRKGEI